MNISKVNIKDHLSKLLWHLRLFATEAILPAIFVNLCIEGFSRESFLRPLLYPFQSPLVFLYNTLLICTTLSVAFLFKRRKCVLFILCALWVIIGITDFALLQFRTTPFTAVDLLLLDSAISIMRRYLSNFWLVVIAIVLLLAIAFTVYLFMHAKKDPKKTSPIYAGLVFGLLLLTSVGSTKLFMTCGILERNFGNLAQSFHINGLPYCFFTSIFGTGISKPSSYSKEEIDRILSTITSSPDETPSVTAPPEADRFPDATASPDPGNTTQKITEHPNFIFLQLESFFDPTYIEGSSFSTDPVPFFRSLKENYSSGFLTVPSIGAGTANTEFEILTGINLDFFGPGEYPYKTILKEIPCESIAYNLSALDLDTHAIHNNRGNFYSRHTVFSKLGFDTFTPIEYMGPYETTPLGWAKDEILIPSIFNALNYSEKQDLIYTISVQAHGAFPEEPLLTDPTVLIESLPNELEKHHYELLYFVNQLYEVDCFLKDLTTALEAYEEEVVLVLYGDHLPTFPFTDEMLTNGSKFQTEYVIWTNRPTDQFIKRDLEAYALTAHVLNCYDIHEGLFTRFHQLRADSDTYMEDMKMLAYDVLYGSYESYGGVLPFQPTELQFGTLPIVIESVHFQNDTDGEFSLHVHGTNFTPYSVIYVNDEACPTTYIDSGYLSTPEFEPAEELVIKVAQVRQNKPVPYAYTEPVTHTVPMSNYPQD